MVLRISLVVAILAGLGATAASQWLLRSHLRQIIQQRDATARDRDRETAFRRSAEADLATTRTERDEALRQATLSAREQKAAGADLEQARLLQARVEASLAEARAGQGEAERALAKWRALGFTVDEVNHFRDAWKERGVELDRLGRLAQALKDDAKRWSNAFCTRFPEQEAPLPTALRGRVVAVDPKWEFVVVNVGASDLVVRDGILLVSRNGRFIANARIVQVEANRSIAQVVRPTQQGEVFEGDLVMARLPLGPVLMHPKAGVDTEDGGG